METAFTRVKACLCRRIRPACIGELSSTLSPHQAIVQVVEHGERVQLVRGNDNLECIGLEEKGGNIDKFEALKPSLKTSPKMKTDTSLRPHIHRPVL